MYQCVNTTKVDLPVHIYMTNSLKNPIIKSKKVSNVDKLTQFIIINAFDKNIYIFKNKC